MLEITVQLVVLGLMRQVRQAAGELQRSGFIGYSRGRIQILNRPKLTKTACECYTIVKSSYERVLQLDPNNSLVYVA